METTMTAAPPLTRQSPEEVLLHFCATHSLAEAELQLWHWFLPAIRESFKHRCPHHTNRLIDFYDELDQALKVIYLLYGPRSQEVPQTTDPPDSRPWDLLISPPE